MSIYKSFEDMDVWKKAMDIAEKVHYMTNSLPKSEDYGLTSQIRRAAVSISANIAEAFGRGTIKEKKYFYIVRGSAFETKSHMIYGLRVQYFNEEVTSKISILIDEVIFELNKIIKSFNSQL